MAVDPVSTQYQPIPGDVFSAAACVHLKCGALRAQLVLQALMFPVLPDGIRWTNGWKLVGSSPALWLQDAGLLKSSTSKGQGPQGFKRSHLTG